MEARYYRKLDDDKVQCELCPHYCVIELGESGKCLVRENHEGTLIATQWGHIAAMQSDPIEKKPLYHFMPGSQVFSIGGYGCNLSCSFCQNWHLSTEVGFTKQVTPERIVSYAEEDGSKAIAYTYNEPVINLEFYLEVAKMARERGLRNVLVSNGYVNPEPLSELLEYLDAANIDVKSFEDRFYRELCDARLEPVLETVRGMAGRIHLELTCLVIPTQNDRDGVTGELAKWIASECGEEVPLHLSAYHPAYRANYPPTSLAQLKRAGEEAREHLAFVYLGNVVPGEWSDTICPNCGAVLIKRRGRTAVLEGLEDGRCSSCSKPTDFLVT